MSVPIRGSESSVKVVVFSPYYLPAVLAGGPVKSISFLVRSSAGPFSTRVVSRNWDFGGAERLRSPANTWVDTGEERIWSYDRGPVPYVRSLLAAACERPRLVYVNSLFDPWTALAPALLWRVLGAKRSDLVVAPRGQLAPGALATSAFRRRLTSASTKTDGGAVVELARAASACDHPCGN